jgi:hypothetical protein
LGSGLQSSSEPPDSTAEETHGTAPFSTAHCDTPHLLLLLLLLLLCISPAGVAAARVNSLFHAARQKAPCIIFIDEIDAIGRSRSSLGGDPGSMERESALLSLLVQMDGIHGHLEQVGLGFRGQGLGCEV